MSFPQHSPIGPARASSRSPAHGPAPEAGTIEAANGGCNEARGDATGRDPGPTRRRLLGLAGTGMLAALALTACGDEGSDSADVADADADARQEALDQALETVGEKYPDARISLGVFDHDAQELFLHAGDTWSYEASIVKVPIALSVLRRITETQGVLGDATKELLTRSVGLSDNAATQELFLSLGSGTEGAVEDSQLPWETDGSGDYESSASASYLNETYQKLGVGRTESDGSWGDNQTWAEDQVQIMRALVERVDWVGSEDLDFLLDIMTPDNDSQDWGGGSMRDQELGGRTVTSVDVKNGWIQDDDGAWHINSVAVVEFGRSKYSLAVVSQGFQDQQTGQDAATDAVQAYFRTKLGA